MAGIMADKCNNFFKIFLENETGRQFISQRRSQRGNEVVYLCSFSEVNIFTSLASRPNKERKKYHSVIPRS